MSTYMNAPALRALRSRLVMGGSLFAFFAATAVPANAIEYTFGEISGSIDTVLSAGASIRTSPRDCENLGQANGGCDFRDATGIYKSSYGVNGDDGNLNYDQWDVFSGAVKATSEMAATWRNFNAFVRGTAFVDPVADNTDFRELESAQRSEVSQNAKLLDYFVGGNFEVGGMPLDVRIGNQVISWGESTFIQNGLNVINPIDVSATRKPGSEVKEFFTPILAAKASIGLPNNFSLEGFYQFKADNIVPDPSGTYFSSADIVGRGSQPLRSGISDFGDDARYNPFAISAGLDADRIWNTPQGVNVPSVSIERENDVNADDGGEFGFALRYFAEELNNGTEFGMYFLNYHSRLPIVNISMSNPAVARSIGSGFLATPPGTPATQAYGGVPGAGFGATPGPLRLASDAFDVLQNACNALAPTGAALAARGLGSANSSPLGTTASVNVALPGGLTNCNNLLRFRNGNAAQAERTLGALLGNSQTYRVEYPEDIKLIGLSFSTTVGDMALQAEATYRHDQPLSYVGSEVQALANDVDGSTAFRTGAAFNGKQIADPTGRFDPADSQVANLTVARSGQLSFADVARAEEAALGLAPGTIATAALTRTPGLQAAADAAGAQGEYVSINPQISTVNPLASAVLPGRPADVAFVRHVDAGPDGAPLTPLIPLVTSSAINPNNIGADGYLKIPTEDVFTAQGTSTMALFGSNPVVQFASADGGTVVTEVGMVFVPGLSTASAIASSNSEGLFNPIAAATYKLNSELKGPTNYATAFSWGAQGVFNLTYNRVFGSPVNLVPQIAWRWDLGGRTPSPLGNYMADRKAIGLSLSANYQSRWTGSVSWTSNFGPDAPLDDRDFASINIAYAF
ncbi:MAG: DUF1302 family protein [Pseudomonadota bacterium]